MGPLTINRAAASLRSSSAAARAEPSFRHWVEYLAAAGLLKFLGWMPRGLSRSICAVLAALSYWFWPRLRRVGLFNLRLAFPERSDGERRRVLFRAFQNLGRTLAHFASFSQW